MKHPLMIKIAFFLAVATGLLFAPAPVSAVTQTFEIQVSASESDAEEDSLGAVNLTDTTLDLGGLYRKVGVRFANVTLQKNAPITRAYIEFSTAGQDSANTTFSIEAVAQDNPTAFTTGIFNISILPVYSEAVDWVMNYAWVTTDEVHQSADITALVQKLVDRSGWASGNAMAFVISNGEDVFRKAKSWNADPAKAPKLHIEYAVNVVDVRVSASTDDINQSSIAAAYTITNGDNVVLCSGYALFGVPVSKCEYSPGGGHQLCVFEICGQEHLRCHHGLHAPAGREATQCADVFNRRWEQRQPLQAHVWNVCRAQNHLRAMVQ